MDTTTVALIGTCAGSTAIAAGLWLASRLNPPQAGRHNPFADPADRDDPYGDNWPPPDDGFWEQRASEMATRPGRLAMLPPDPDPDPTIVQPHDVAYLGKTSQEFVDDLFAEHAPKPEMLP